MSLQLSISTLTVAAAFGSALVAGVMFAFSTFVMDGLGRVEPWHGMRAMQLINKAAVTPPFMTLLMGTAVISIALALVLPFAEQAVPGRSWMLAGAAVYAVGVIAVTIVGNVPMNNALAGLSASESGGLDYWAAYLSRWTLLNHVRTVTAAAAAAAFFVAFSKGASGSVP